MAKKVASQSKKRTNKPRKAMVIVHGGADIPENYYENVVSAVKKRLGKSFKFISAYYSDVVTGRTGRIAAMAAVAESPEVARFKAEYEKQLRDAHAKNQAEKRALGTAAFLDSFIDKALTDTVNEVVQYLFNKSVTSEVQARLIEALDQATQKNVEIVLVSHSLGTVVSFDVLKQFADRYKIAYWFTLGCPLLKLVKLRCREAALGEINDSRVARWHNVYDTNDFVADAIGASFHAPDCRIHDIFVEVANAMPAAHDYFNNAETDDVLAEAMR